MNARTNKPVKPAHLDFLLTSTPQNVSPLAPKEHLWTLTLDNAERAPRGALRASMTEFVLPADPGSTSIQN